MQDVNPAQFRLLTTMLADDPDLFVVGDPNQSVYGFNGADPPCSTASPRSSGVPRSSASTRTIAAPPKWWR